MVALQITTYEHNAKNAVCLVYTASKEVADIKTSSMDSVPGTSAWLRSELQSVY